MKKGWKYAGIIVIILLVIMQFFDPAPINPVPQPGEMIFTYRPASEEVITLLTNTCFDCHSNQPDYPWYAYVAPMSWIIENHVDNGRDHVNFSEWPKYTPDEHKEILEKSIEEIIGEHQPLQVYQWLHPETRLNKQQQDSLVDYFTSRN